MTIKVTYNITDVYMSQSVSPVYITVSYAEGGSGGGAVWGAITGTLSNQTDLQNALNAKFDDPTGTTLQYIDGTGALQTFPLTLPVLQEVRNQTGATLAAGTVVYINGATGNKPTVTKAIATGDATSAQTLGMISAAIANNGVGYVVVIGTCGGLDTSAYTEGQQLYLSGTVAGGVTTTKPYAPIHLVYVGIVTRSHPNLGTVEVRLQNGFEMDEIHNVSAQTPSNNDGLFYNTTTSLWESKAITTALGYTPVPTTRNITINGVTYDLSADRTWTISTGISGSGASGQVTYWTGASAVSGSNNLFWDNTNGRLGIGTNAPTESIQVVAGNILIDNNRGIRTKNTSGSTLDVLKADTSNNLLLGSLFLGGAFYLYTNTSFRWFQYPSSVATERMQLSTLGNLLIGSTADNGQRLQVYGDTLLRGSGNTSATTALTVQNSSSTNLFTVGNSGITTLTPLSLSGSDATSALSISQTWNTTGAPIGLFMNITNTASNNTSRLIDLRINNTSLFNVSRSIGGYTTGGPIALNGYGFGTGIVGIYGVDANNNLSTSSTAIQFSDSNNGQGYSYYFHSGQYSSKSYASGTGGFISILRGFAAITGNGVFNAVNIENGINQTGGANGITRGLYVNPTLTAAADWRSIQWDNNSGWGLYGAGTANNYLAGNLGIGTTSVTNWLNIAASTTAKAHINLVAGSTPTAPANGDIWFDGTDIKMRIGGVTKTFTLV